MIIGFSDSPASGEKSQNARTIGFIDNWIVNTDLVGAIKWENVYGGDDGGERAFGFVFDNSGNGWLLGATTSYQSNFERQAAYKNSVGSNGWLVHINSSGDYVWDSTFAGLGVGSSTSGLDLISTSDGGFMGVFDSNQDAGFNKSEDGYGDRDVWVVKFDAGWNVEWDVTLGGTEDDNTWPDNIIESPAGGYLVAIRSESGASGVRTDANRGDRDLWLVKLTAAGAIEWQKVYGGTDREFLGAITIASDGNYVVAASSESGAGFEKSQGNLGGYDYWVLKLAPDGSVIWEKTIGTDQPDIVEDVLAYPDGRLLIGGYTEGGASGNKTDANNGGYDYWLVMLDASGSQLWDRAFGGSAHDVFRDMTTTQDGNLVLAGQSSSDQSGDKSEDSRGNSDYWLIKTKPDIPLALGMAGFSAELAAPRRARLQWRYPAAAANSVFEVWRTQDGKNWTKACVIPATAEPGNDAYAFADTLPASGYYYYKIRYAPQVGGDSYSRVLDVYAPPFEGGEVTIYPNPDRETARLRVEATKPGLLQLTLFGPQGRAVLRRRETISGDFADLDLKLDGLPAGVYIARIETPGGVSWLKVLKE